MNHVILSLAIFGLMIGILSVPLIGNAVFFVVSMVFCVPIILAEFF